jgi:hypothetical protein
MDHVSKGREEAGTRVAESDDEPERHAFGDYCREGGRNEEA